MRTRIAVLAVLIAAIALMGTPAIAAAPPASSEPGATCQVEYTAGTFRSFAHRVWAFSRWRREPKGQPKDATIEKMRKMRRCAAGEGHRLAMRHAWKTAKHAYYRHRKEEIAWMDCPDSIREASEAFDVPGWILNGVAGAESTWGVAANIYGLLAAAGSADVTDWYSASMQAAKTLRYWKDAYGTWEYALNTYNSGSPGSGYGVAHIRAMANSSPFDCP